MSFVRPEARAAMMRWRETLAGVAASAVGLYLVLTAYGAGFLIGAGLLAGGVALTAAGVQRARFRQGGGGAGIVQVVEGQIAYFGPFGGGTVAQDALEWIDLEPGVGGHPVWVLIETTGNRIEVPSNAEGADDLFDVFAALPGLDTRAAVKRLTHPVRERTPVWRRDAPRLH